MFSYMDYGKGRNNGKGRKWACALRSLGFLHGYFLSHRNCRKHRNLFFSARIFLFKLSHGLHRCFHIWITEKDGNDGNLLLYYMIVEGGVGVFAYNTLNFIVLRYICGCLGRWHFGMSDMVRLFGVPFGI